MVSDARVVHGGKPVAENSSAVDSFGKIETRGIDRVPADERHGRPSELFAVWLSANAGYLYILLGGTLSVLGLSVPQAFAVLVAGSLFWGLVGLLAVSGPASGTPSEIVTRAVFGVRGNRVFGAGLGWLVAVIYEGINLALGALAAFSLLSTCGVHVGVTVKVIVTVLLGAVTFTLSLYGHATIVRFGTLFSAVLGACVLVLAGFVGRHATLHPAHFTPLGGHALWAAVLIGFSVIASAPLSWGSGADYARYLPEHSSPWKVAAWTAAGGFLPSVVLGGIGILAGSAVDMSDPQESMRVLVPAWFYTVFLGLIVVGTVANNVLTAYSSGLSLQAMGLRASRVRSIVIDAIIGGALCAYALLSSSFLTAVNNILLLTVAFLGPFMAVYATDILLRRNRYDGEALHDERPGAPFWYWRGFSPAGSAAMLIGTAAAALCLNTTLFVGPVAHALGGADLSSLVGPAVACLIYFFLAKNRLETRA
ncbi:purine-cytosine permease family protein [Streptomyces sp. NPDC090075]|uniref:purine-cytosine permease family protein n=1 Tax=Streptomyces sp. NPDC090075 TaxID=3365937 RepID=UPI003830C4B2